MLDIVPNIVEGAVVLDLFKECRTKSKDCLECPRLMVFLHNWAKTVGLEYFIFDLQEEKTICPVFLYEVIQLRKRLDHPFLFSGALGYPKEVLESYSCGSIYPLFLTPEDAIRALRMQNPGLTEVPLKWHKTIGVPILESIKPSAEHKNHVPVAIGEDLSHQ